MASFDTAYGILKGNEGWGAPSVDNNGARVRDGINQADFPNMPDGFYSGSMDDKTALAVSQGHYRAVEWAQVKGDQIADQTLANHLLDMAVNAGIAGAVKLLQATINDSTGGSLDLDGVMGPETLAAANAHPALATAYRAARIGYYVAESFRASGKAWLGTWLGRLRHCG